MKQNKEAEKEAEKYTGVSNTQRSRIAQESQHDHWEIQYCNGGVKEQGRAQKSVARVTSDPRRGSFFFYQQNHGPVRG